MLLYLNKHFHEEKKYYVTENQYGIGQTIYHFAFTNDQSEDVYFAHVIQHPDDLKSGMALITYYGKKDDCRLWQKYTNKGVVSRTEIQTAYKNAINLFGSQYFYNIAIYFYHDVNGYVEIEMKEGNEFEHVVLKERQYTDINNANYKNLTFNQTASKALLHEDYFAKIIADYFYIIGLEKR